MTTRNWKLLNVLTDSTVNDLGLLILNQPLQEDLLLLQQLWGKAVVRACADGGSNRLYDVTGQKREHFIPHIVSGDFDSIRDEVMQFYKDKGCDIVQTEDQNFTDFTKCFKLVQERYGDKKMSSYCVLGAFGGRLDQVFANIDTLYTMNSLAPGVPVYLLSHHSLACLLPVGSHTLHVDSGHEGDWCGLIPVGEQCEHVTTTGLKWNLNKQQLKFGELVSTSNTWEDSKVDVVTVETNSPLLWTMGVA